MKKFITKSRIKGVLGLLLFALAFIAFNHVSASNVNNVTEAAILGGGGMNLSQLMQLNPSLFTGVDPALVNKIQTNAAKQKATRHYSRRLVTLSGTSVELIDENQDKGYGIKSFKFGALDQNTVFLILGISLKYAYDASDTNLYNKRYTNLLVNPYTYASGPQIDPTVTAGLLDKAPIKVQLIPNNLLNGEFQLNIDEASKWNGPSGDFFQESDFSKYLRGSDEEFINLGASPILVRGGQKMQGILRFNPLSTAPTGNNFIEVAFAGVELS